MAVWQQQAQAPPQSPQEPAETDAGHSEVAKLLQEFQQFAGPATKIRAAQQEQLEPKVSAFD